MKNVLLMLVLFSGLAISSASAQSCKPANCAPCPPGCCIINCCTDKGAAADAKGKSDVTYASLVAYDAAGKEIKMSKKEMKACMASCKKANVATETSTAAASQPNPCCPPGCIPAGKETSALPVYKASLSKS